MTLTKINSGIGDIMNCVFNEFAHNYIRAWLQTGYIPIVKRMWLLSNFSIVRLTDIVNDEVERLLNELP